MCSFKEREDLNKLLFEDINHNEKKPIKTKAEWERELKLQRDKQLLEFEERGGVNAVLNELYLPHKSLPENDTVYWLK